MDYLCTTLCICHVSVTNTILHHNAGVTRLLYFFFTVSGIDTSKGSIFWNLGFRNVTIIRKFLIKKIIPMAPMYYTAVNFAPRWIYTHVASPLFIYLLLYIPQSVLNIAVPLSGAAPAAMCYFHRHSTLPPPGCSWLPWYVAINTQA